MIDLSFTLNCLFYCRSLTPCPLTSVSDNKETNAILNFISALNLPGSSPRSMWQY